MSVDKRHFQLGPSMKNDVGGIVLCGGHSRRMGVPKATLPFGDELMLPRVVRLLGEVASPIVAVAAGQQSLPALSDDVVIARDERPDQGPLEGIRVGLSAIQAHTETAFVTSCDVPLLRPRFVARMVDMLGDYDVCVPVDDQFAHPLAGVYRTGVISTIESLLAADRRRPVFLFENTSTRRVPVDELRDVDPQLESLMNLNDPASYRQALAVAELDPPEVDPFA